MEIELKHISFDADVYDVRKSVELVLHGPDLYDPNSTDNKGRKPNFEVVMGKSPAGRIHNGTAILRVPVKLGQKLLQWNKESEKNKIVVKGKSLRIFNAHRRVPPDVKQTLEKALYIDPEQDKLRTEIEEQARQVRLRIASIQSGVWYKEPNAPPNQGRSFSIEYERDFLRHSAAYINLVYEHSLIRIDIGQRETEETNYLVLVKFSSIRKFGIGYDEFGQAFIVFDLHTPPNFEQESYNNRLPDGMVRKGKYKTRDRISSLDEAHGLVAPYAPHLRILLADPNDLLHFEKICHAAQCEPRPIRVPRVDANAMKFFSHRDLFHVQRWIKTMEWKNAFQIEAYLRCGLLTTHDLLFSLQKPIEDAIRYYGTAASDFLGKFSTALRMRKMEETPIACLERFRSDHPVITPLRLAQGHISCHHVIITPSRILLEGPYTTQSNRVIRHYQNHDPNLVERFIRVEFRDEDHLNYRWDGDVDGTWFLQQRVGGMLREGFELGGRAFEFLAYSTSALREHSVWFVSPFRDPVEGYVTAEKIRASLETFLNSCACQASTRHGLHRHSLRPILAVGDMIWDERRRINGNLRESRVKPSAYQFRFLGYKGVVVVDSRLEGIRMRLRKSQQKFPVHNVTEAGFEIARSFDYPNPVHLNRPAIMALEDRGVKAEAFLDLQDKAKADIYLSSNSLEDFKVLLMRHGLGGTYHLGFIVEQLSNLGLDFNDNNDKKAIKSAFFERLLRYAMNHSLREVKYKARIPVPHSYQLVGVADEGQAYINEGVDPSRVFTLKEGFIYVCVQEAADKEPEYFKGTCLISRSPVIHPGDVQRVYAVGEPPKDKICFFRNLKNVVVLPAIGNRSLASGLAGGDLDGDTYDIYIGNPALLPTIQAPSASYPPGEIRMLDKDRGDATVEDICDFIVEYINSDVMGLLADRHIVIADQSKDGVFDERCMRLAALCSKAVDYPKNGVPVDIHNNNLPKTLIKFKPDWHKAEVTGARELDYYVSDRALGHLFRNIKLLDPNEPIDGLPTTSGEIAPLQDPISLILAPLVQTTLNLEAGAEAPGPPGPENAQAERLHAHYMREMTYICVTHTLVDAPDVRLKEEEVVLGTILANCTQPRWRNDRSHRMRIHAESLLRDISVQIIQSDGPPTPEQLREGLPVAWGMWGWAQHHRDKEFIKSFSLVALRIILDCLKRLDALPKA
ncbi:RNA dependent RNA polymerase-domain-containing protein [Multifurca ochricompacta]|uniref:RNA-dependent RNA polymerase n=1 Tax=Multifurca ochricompacta TaxID=376703 RepID=A0AAD4MAW0_9AGAM|nr:RNA dependent RNA polymerase-domain-containing protein [Multifurca ochricompacta]